MNYKKIGELCHSLKKSVRPETDTIYNVFSLPAFDDKTRPEKLSGSEIKSNKFKVFEDTILFNKLNVKYRRIWNIHKLTTSNNISSTEFIPLVVENGVDQDYLYHCLRSDDVVFAMHAARKGTSNSQQRIDEDILFSYEIPVPSLEEQRKISSILNSIDERIKVNEEINDNLLQQLDALYHEIFDNCQMKLSCPAGSYFDISIGKTPPRKEQWWFTSNASDIKWVSISDMGNCGTYISNSSEYLTQDAVNKFNVVVVPDNTVILSFKLTVGRLAITDGDLTTNEAIAHFKTDNKAINPYLYFYLRNYKYETLGSTSSIATAVNSKIIKNMPFLLPHDAELYKFNELALPLMEKIKQLEHENKYLGQLRDSLLPKLMSGEIDVDSIEL